MTDPLGRQIGASALHLSGSRTGTVQSRGTTALSSQRLLVLNEEALRCLAAETRIQESKRGKMDEVIEKQVNDFLDSLDKKTKAQLSKTQMIKSVQKVYKWRKELRHRKPAGVVKAIPKEYLDADLDPGAYREKHFKAILARGGPLIGNGSSSGSPGSPPSSLSASGNNMPPPGAFSGPTEKMERALDGEHFENFILPTCPSRDRETAISAKRAIQMKDWLGRRANYQMERDRIKKWLTTMAKKDDLSQEELLRIYQRKRKELSLEQIKEILNMPVRFPFFPLSYSRAGGLRGSFAFYLGFSGSAPFTSLSFHCVLANGFDFHFQYYSCFMKHNRYRFLVVNLHFSNFEFSLSRLPQYLFVTHPDYPFQDSSVLTINQLLGEYRGQVQATGDDDSDDDDSDEDDDDDDDDDDDEMQGILPARNTSAAIQLSSRAAVGNSTPHFGGPGPSSHYYK